MRPREGRYGPLLDAVQGVSLPLELFALAGGHHLVDLGVGQATVESIGHVGTSRQTVEV